MEWVTNKTALLQKPYIIFYEKTQVCRASCTQYFNIIQQNDGENSTRRELEEDEEMLFAMLKEAGAAGKYKGMNAIITHMQSLQDTPMDKHQYTNVTSLTTSSTTALPSEKGTKPVNCMY